jgi:hypothetical protein
MVDMIRGARPLDGSMFAGGPLLSPAEQIGVYRDQYRMRMWDALLDDTKGLHALLGDDAERVFWAYLDACPPRDWTLARIADRLVPWLETNGAPAEQVEMARLDEAVERGFVAADVPVPDVAAVAAAGPGTELRLQPHVTLLSLTWNVHHVRSAISSDQDVPALVSGRWSVVVYRHDRQMRHLEVEPGAFAALHMFAAGGTVGAAVEAAVAEVGDPVATVGKLPGWFRMFAARGWLASS